MDNPRTAALAMIEARMITREDLWVRYWANVGAGREQGFEAVVNRALSSRASDLATTT